MQKEHTLPRKLLVSAFLLGFAMFAPMNAVPPLEHILREELVINHTQASLVFTLPLVMVIALSIPGGFITDRIGVRKAGGIGSILIAAGSLLRGFAPDYISLLAFTLIYGIGFAMVFPNVPKLISLWVPREKAGVATGVFLVGFAFGVALPIAITLPLVYPVANSLQGTFFIWAIPTIAAAILWWMVVKDTPRETAGEGALSLGTLSYHQVFRNKELWLVAMLMFLNNFFMFTWVGWAPALMMQKGAEPTMATLIASVSSWAVIPTAYLAPRLSFELGVRKPFIWVPSFVLAFTSLGAIFMNIPMAWVLMSLVGMFNASRFVTIMALPVEMMSREAVGRASGLILSIGYIGATIGPLIGGRIFDLTGSLNTSLVLLIGISLATASLGLMLPETGSRPKTSS